MSIQLERRGRRTYFIGDTYTVKGHLREAGAHWDADARAWWIGDHAAAEALVAELSAGKASQETTASSTEAPGQDAVVAGSVMYQGRSAYVAGRVVRGRTHHDDQVEGVMTRDGSKLLLYSRDGLRSWWVPRDAVEVRKRYDRPQTIGRLQAFAERAKTARAQGYEDGIAEGARYECEECGERVTRGQGTCWETGAPH